MSIINVNTGTAARAIHVQQIINWLRGLPSYSEPVSLTGITSSSTYALSVANLDSAGQALRVRNSAQSVDLLTVNHAGTQVRPNTAIQSYIFRVRNFANDTSLLEVTESGVSVGGADIVTTTATQALTNKTLTAAILNSNVIGDFLEFTSQSGAPATPASGKVRLYTRTANDFPRYMGNAGIEKTLVDTDSSQTLSTKVLSSPSLNSPNVTDYADFSLNSAPGTPGASNLYLYAKTATSDLRYKATGSATERIIIDDSQSQTLSSKTLASPTLNSPAFSDYGNFSLTTAPGTPGAAQLFLYGKTSTNDLRYKAAASATEHIVIDDSSSQTLTNKTITSPVINSPVIGTGINTDSFIDYSRTTTPAAPSSTKLRVYAKTGSTSLFAQTNTSGELEIVDTTSAQTISGKTFGTISLTAPTLSNPNITNYEDYTAQASTPGNPSAGKTRIWAKTDNNLYMNAGSADTLILTSANTSLPAGSSITRSLMLGVL